MEGKELVRNTLELLEKNGFIRDTSLLNGKPIFYKSIYKNIYIVFYYFNSGNKNYDIHCFDLFISNSRRIDELRKKDTFGEFRILSFNFKNELHLRIFNELMAYQNEMQPGFQFDLLNKKYHEIYYS